MERETQMRRSKRKKKQAKERKKLGYCNEDVDEVSRIHGIIIF
jgi:hypothetical protein